MSSLSFGAWLKEMRRRLDLTQEDLGLQIGYSGRTLEKIEAGQRRPSKEVALLLAQALAVPEAEHEAFVEFARNGLPPGMLPAEEDSGSPWRLLRRRPNNLPAPRTSFVGRERVVSEVGALLERPAVRLLTLVGPPGVGKTRLSLHLASRILARFRDGVFFVPLGA